MEANTALNVERDLAFVCEMASSIKDYLLGNELYEKLSARNYRLPLGTLGGLFLRFHRLRALSDQLTPSQQAAFEEAHGHIEVELDRWAAQAEDKVQRESKARLRNWREYLLELARDPKHFTREYTTQVEGRTILDLLADYSGENFPQELGADLRAADTHLRDNTVTGDFIWAEEMQPAFPSERFWWLYTEPRKIGWE